ncbi:MAG: DNA polymerase III subunit delta [Candidatus Westeberhardia cardiocondylae]|nr:DNA polymerase III subunit delta [Candidatus Westeberhardia cardiocondylae]
MFYCVAGKLKKKLKKKFFSCYFLFGNDPFLLLESEKLIYSYAKLFKFEKCLMNIDLNKKIDWDKLYNLCLSKDLFSFKQIILIVFPDILNDFNIIYEKLYFLISLLHCDLLLIIKKNKQLNTLQKTNKWFKEFLKQDPLLVNCNTPLNKDFYEWTKYRAKKMKLTLTNVVCQFLCNCYEGNLLALSQTLKMLSLMFSNEILTLSKVKTVTNDLSYFNVYKWVDELLIGNDINYVCRILHKLKLEGFEPIILLRCIQREILLILNIKYKFNNKNKNCSIQSILEKNKIWKVRQKLIEFAVNRFTIPTLKKSIKLMMKIELLFKMHCYDFVWMNLHYLSLLLCSKTIKIDNFYY